METINDYEAIMKTINDLETQWHEIVFTYEKEADRAWREVEPESTDSEGEVQYYRDLINTAEGYINNK